MTTVSGDTIRCLAVGRGGFTEISGHADRPVGTIWRCALDEAEGRQAWSLADGCRQTYCAVENDEFMRDAGVIAQELPRTLRAAANAARLDERLNALVISNDVVPDGTLEPTPSHWRQADTEGSRTHAFLLAICAGLLGDAICWATQQAGRVITDVLPIPGAEASLLSSSSTKELGWHTEDAFSPCRADYVGLQCLRNPLDVPTTLSYLDASVLPDDVAAALASELFHIAPDYSHGVAGTQGESAGAAQAPLVRLLGGSPEAPILRIDRDFTSVPGDGQAARLALDWLITHLDGNVYELALKPGDICFIDNRNVVHGRRSFQPRYDGSDRWLKRVNIAIDLRRTRQGRANSASRVIG